MSTAIDAAAVGSPRSLAGQDDREAAEDSRDRGASVRLLLRAGALAVVVGLLALLLGGGRPVAAPLGLPDAGMMTGWALRSTRLLGDLAAILTVGALLVPAVLVPREGGGTARRSAARAAVRWAWGWAALSTAAVVLTVSDTIGVPVTRLAPNHLLRLGSSGQAGAHLTAASMAVVVAVTLPLATSLRARRALLAVAVVGLVPTALVGHAATATDHDVATAGLIVHVVAAALWVGGLAGILVHLRGSWSALSFAVPRFSVLALGAYTALAVSGALTATTRLGTSLSAWTSSYGCIVVAKVALLLALGVAGHRHRRRTIRELGLRRRGPFLRLAGLELLLMGAAMGLAAALSRTPVPATPVAAAPEHGGGHSTLPSSVAELSLAELTTAWRLNALVLVVLGVAVAWYVAGVRKLARREETWPPGRTVAFVAGILLALVDLCSGVATYATALVSVQLTQMLVALIGVPVLLALGAPVTLGIRLHGPDGTVAVVLRSAGARRLANPVVGAALVSVLVLGLYRTPLIELSLRSTWMHLLVLLLAVLTGWLLVWPVLAVDPLPRSHGLGDRMACVMGVVGCLLLLSAQLLLGDRLLAGRWFRELAWSWVDPVSDQRFGGAVVAVVAVAALAVLAIGAHVTDKASESNAAAGAH